ncbi:hypothetical protein ACU4GR_04720 [Methylobacterium oryzae CBMB20]
MLVDARARASGHRFAAIRTPKWRRVAEGIQELHAKQLVILNSASRLLKPGGRLVYATCSLLDAENESVAEAFAEAHPEFNFISAHRTC